jgi:deoxyhypusine synthase
VTDTCIPEDIMRHVEARLIERWRSACETGERKFEAEFLMDVLRSGEIDQHFQVPREHSWLAAAMDMGIPVYSPGWEDSTLGNMFAANVVRGRVPHHQCVKSGTEQFQHLIGWYLENNGEAEGKPSVGFFQIGGGIAGDFAICVVPASSRIWSGTPRSGATSARSRMPRCPTEDTRGRWRTRRSPGGSWTWTRPKFNIHSDASIVAPSHLRLLLGD